MMHYDEYVAPDAEVEALLDRSELGRLITRGADGTPNLGLFPFYRGDGAIHLHLNRQDEQLADLERSPRVLFQVDELLATTPSHWLHPENARMATAYHRCASFVCQASASLDPAAIAAGQNRIMERYQRDGGYRAVAADDELYRGSLELLAAVTLRVVERRVKFKLAQNRPPEVRREIAARLRERGAALDEATARAIEGTLEA